MDGGFFTFDEILAGQTQAPGVGLSQAGPVWNFDRLSNVNTQARASAAKAPPGLTLAQIDRLGQTNFQAHHIFPVAALNDRNDQQLII